MRVAWPSLFGEGNWLAWKLGEEGHEVSVSVAEPACRDAMRGLVNHVEEFETPTAYDLAVFDVTGQGELADRTARLIPTIGDSSLADRLEDDRLYALEFMEKCGIQVPPWEHFTNPADAIRYIKKQNTRQVFKPVGEQDDKSTTYVSSSAEDMLRYFDVLFRSTPQKEFVLQEVMDGTEVSTEVFLNDSGHFALNHTLELKKLMNGDVGPNTGCSGSLCWMAATENPIFAKGLKKALDPLRELGYSGPIDLNAIVNRSGVYGLEFCARFGYDATALLTRMLPVGFGDFLYAVATNQKVPELPAKHSFVATTRLSIPPYPSEGLPEKFYKAGVPIEGLTPAMLDRFFLYDVRRREDSDELESAGICGWIGGPLAVGETINQAWEGTKDMISQVKIPNCQHRTDCPQNTARRYEELRSGGWLR